MSLKVKFLFLYICSISCAIWSTTESVEDDEIIFEPVSWGSDLLKKFSLNRSSDKITANNIKGKICKKLEEVLDVKIVLNWVNYNYDFINFYSDKSLKKNLIEPNSDIIKKNKKFYYDFGAPFSIVGNKNKNTKNLILKFFSYQEILSTLIVNKINSEEVYFKLYKNFDIYLPIQEVKEKIDEILNKEPALGRVHFKKVSRITIKEYGSNDETNIEFDLFKVNLSIDQFASALYEQKKIKKAFYFVKEDGSFFDDYNEKLSYLFDYQNENGASCFFFKYYTHSIELSLEEKEHQVLKLLLVKATKKKSLIVYFKKFDMAEIKKNIDLLVYYSKSKYFTHNNERIKLNRENIEKLKKEKKWILSPTKKKDLPSGYKFSCEEYYYFTVFFFKKEDGKIFLEKDILEKYITPDNLGKRLEKSIEKEIKKRHKKVYSKMPFLEHFKKKRKKGLFKVDQIYEKELNVFDEGADTDLTKTVGTFFYGWTIPLSIEESLNKKKKVYLLTCKKLDKRKDLIDSYNNCKKKFKKIEYSSLSFKEDEKVYQIKTKEYYYFKKKITLDLSPSKNNDNLFSNSFSCSFGEKYRKEIRKNKVGIDIEIKEEVLKKIKSERKEQNRETPHKFLHLALSKDEVPNKESTKKFFEKLKDNIKEREKIKVYYRYKEEFDSYIIHYYQKNDRPLTERIKVLKLFPEKDLELEIGKKFKNIEISSPLKNYKKKGVLSAWVPYEGENHNNLGFIKQSDCNSLSENQKKNIFYGYAFGFCEEYSVTNEWFFIPKKDDKSVDTLLKRCSDILKNNYIKSIPYPIEITSLELKSFDQSSKKYKLEFEAKAKFGKDHSNTYTYKPNKNETTKDKPSKDEPKVDNPLSRDFTICFYKKENGKFIKKDKILTIENLDHNINSKILKELSTMDIDGRLSPLSDLKDKKATIWMPSRSNNFSYIPVVEKNWFFLNAKVQSNNLFYGAALPLAVREEEGFVNSEIYLIPKKGETCVRSLVQSYISDIERVTKRKVFLDTLEFDEKIGKYTIKVEAYPSRGVGRTVVIIGLFIIFLGVYYFYKKKKADDLQKGKNLKKRAKSKKKIKKGKSTNSAKSTYSELNAKSKANKKNL